MKSKPNLLKGKLITILLIFVCFYSSAQVAINKSGNLPNPSAILDISDTTSGLLIPRMTELQRSNIANPANGLLVYITNNNEFFYYNGSSWVSFTVDNWSVGENKIFTESNYNVGIGIPNPSEKLEVNGNVNIVGDALLDNNGRLYFKNPTGGDLAFYRNIAGFGVFRDYGHIYTITQNWAVGDIASENLEATMALVRSDIDEVNSEFLDLYNNGYSSETQFGIRMQKRGSGQYRDFVFDYFDGNTKTEVMRIKPNGFVGIGTSQPQTKLHVTGLSEYNDNADAINAGLTAGAIYRTGDLLKVVH